ncbi:hypothetical protein AFLA_000588 [Aspergillus flavus NRRL3357]|nr:hypothetical protein AFLA_000588 [Aspergillus flavus NRRL3357]
MCYFPDSGDIHVFHVIHRAKASVTWLWLNSRRFFPPQRCVLLDTCTELDTICAICLERQAGSSSCLA